jgi:hypothetical protein
MLFLLLLLSLGCINGIQLALIGLLIVRVSLIYMKVRNEDVMFLQKTYSTVRTCGEYAFQA